MATEWHDSWSEDHPVRREAAGGTEPVEFVSIEYALKRLAKASVQDDTVREALMSGTQLRSPFAYYRLVTKP